MHYYYGDDILNDERFSWNKEFIQRLLLKEDKC